MRREIPIGFSFSRRFGVFSFVFAFFFLFFGGGMPNVCFRFTGFFGSSGSGLDVKSMTSGMHFGETCNQGFSKTKIKTGKTRKTTYHHGDVNLAETNRTLKILTFWHQTWLQVLINGTLVVVLRSL